MSGFHKIQCSSGAGMSNPPLQISVPKGPDFNISKDKGQ